VSALEILVRILPIFLILGFGAVLRGVKAADDGWVDILNKYGLYVGFPALVLDNLGQVSREDFVVGLKTYGVNIALLVFIIAATWSAVKLLKLERDLANSYVISGFFGNIAYLGYPVITSVYSGVQVEMSILVAIYVVLLFTVGVGILEASKVHKFRILPLLLNIVKNPLLIATGAGILMVLVDLHFPFSLGEALRILKASVSPVVILALGIFIVRKIRLREVYGHVFGISVLRLFVIPLLFFAVGKGLRLLPGFSISVILSGMPLAVTPFALSSIYPLDKNVIGSAIVLSTLLSIVTLPLMMAALS
jgi:predicted permease